jgi:HK97 family phage portal protein
MPSPLARALANSFAGPPSIARSVSRGLIGSRLTRTTDSTLDAMNWADWGWSVPTAAGIAVNQASAMQLSAVYACVTILSYDLAKLGASIFQGERFKGKRVKAKNHYLFPLLTRPANWLTWFEFCGMLECSVLLRGNGYAVILRDFNGKPTQLVPINPDRVALWEAPDGELFYMVTRSGLHEMAVLRNEPLLIHSDDIFHLKALTMNGLLGLSPIGMARESIALGLAQEQLASRWAANSAKPSGVLTTEQKLTPEAAARLANDWKTTNSGLYNAGRVAVLEQGLKWEPISMTLQDMEFISSRQFQLAEIARVFRVPLHMLGELTRTTGNSITQQGQEYLNYSLSTWIEMWEQRIAFTFDLPENLFISFDVDRLLRADIQTRFAAHKAASGGSGWMTINEIRDMESEGNVPGGDKVLRPANTVPLDQVVTPGANPAGVGSEHTGEGGEDAGSSAEHGAQKG